MMYNIATDPLPLTKKSILSHRIHSFRIIMEKYIFESFEKKSEFSLDP